jgi:hypothetical protein
MRLGLGAEAHINPWKEIVMQRKPHTFAVLLASVLLLANTMTFAAPSAKKYQVTGKIIELNDRMIVVQTVKGDERWEIERSADTKVEGELKVGAKVTIEYRLVATSAEGKAEN